MTTTTGGPSEILMADLGTVDIELDLSQLWPTTKEREIARLQAQGVNPMSDPQQQLVFEQCFDQVLGRPLPNSSEIGQLFCPRTFDGWACWNDTPAGENAYSPCPSFVPGFTPDNWAFKVCMEDGQWFRHPETNVSWSNYTTCVDVADLEFRQKINDLYIIGYSISAVALFVSLMIFFSFSSLRCDRIVIHKNLFCSFIINNIMWILWYIFVIKDTEVIANNLLQCQALHVIVHYFLLCNYFWMFCEGLYLHTLLVVAFVSEASILKWFYVIGWLLPVPVILLYTAFRATSGEEEDTRYCWINDSRFSWIWSGPVVVSILLNFFFLINIVRVLVTKLRAFNSPDNHQTRKAVRATLILIPLLGLQFVLTPFRPPPGSPGEAVYELFSVAFTSLQGLAVAMLFCFCNGEVIAVVKKFIQAKLPAPRWQPIKQDRARSIQTTV